MGLDAVTLPTNHLMNLKQNLISVSPEWVLRTEYRAIKNKMEKFLACNYARHTTTVNELMGRDRFLMPESTSFR